LKAEEHLELQLFSEESSKELSSTIDYHLFFVKIKLETFETEASLISNCLDLIQKYGPPSFNHLVTFPFFSPFFYFCSISPNLRFF